MGTTEDQLVITDREQLDALIVGYVSRREAIPDELRESMENVIRDEITDHRTDDYAVSRDSVPDEIMDWKIELLDGFVSPARIDALADEAEPTPTETALWRREYLRKALDNDDADLSEVICMATIEDQDGDDCVCLATMSGYSFSGLEVRFHGFFPDAREAYEHLRANFYTTLDELDRSAEFKAVLGFSYDPDTENGGKEEHAEKAAEASSTECPLCGTLNTLSAGRSCAHAIAFIRDANLSVVTGSFGTQAEMGRLTAAWDSFAAARVHCSETEAARRLAEANLPESVRALARTTEFRYVVEGLPYARVVVGRPGARDVYVEGRTASKLRLLARDLDSAGRAIGGVGADRDSRS